MGDSGLQVEITIVGEDSDAGDAEELERLSLQLRRELLELDVYVSAASAESRSAPNTRSAEPLAVGALIVSLVNASGTLPALVDILRSWLTRLGRRTIRIELDGDVLELSSASSQERQELIKTWVARHSHDQR